MKVSTISALAFATGIQAHIVIDKPVPFGQATLNNSPLKLADFPCKQRSGVYDVTQMNEVKAGDNLDVQFKGTAVHGGGSCQFSMTTDKEPDTNSRWAVIHSIEGGCPTKEFDGNVPPEVSAESPDYLGDSYPIPIPANVSDGVYTFAWSWINKVGGQGEFYMNCAPVTVSGSSVKAEEGTAFLDSLPTMFVANLDQTCITHVDGDFSYPTPGDSVSKKQAFVEGKAASGGGCDAIAKLAMGNGNMNAPSDGTPSDGNSPSAPASSEPAAAPSSAAPSNPGGVFAPGASSAAPAPSVVPTTLATQPAAPPAAPTSAAASQAPVGTGAPAPPAATGAPGQYIDCSENGKMICVSATEYAICNWGKALVQPMAAGTDCVEGAVAAHVVQRHPHVRHRRHGAGRLF
ncbi:hypothetical protein EJ04DRAFT_479594 [Polyplosphaeria fusca]|uniref:Carbohydrate-binding module family 19 domain-containing protein n=1 Tax=Polyplosphaeria fusca TaxID=682080 RepID=A0A9P4QJZ7_9PLEO|nr:hypothetical protein EJ04DRAFT_479594 [Polyplosphaeria fusca]